MNSITYKADIIKELSQELNISEKEIAEIVDLNISYIKKSIVEKDYVIINLPNLCKLRFNYRLGISALKTIKESKKQKCLKRFTHLQAKIKVLDDYKKSSNRAFMLMNYNKPLFERLWRKYKRTGYVDSLYKKMYTMLIELEERTNEIISEIT